MEFIAAGGVTLILVILSVIIDVGRASARNRAIEDRVRFEQRRLDLILEQQDPDQLGTLSNRRSHVDEASRSEDDSAAAVR